MSEQVHMVSNTCIYCGAGFLSPKDECDRPVEDSCDECWTKNQKEDMYYSGYEPDDDEEEER